MKENIKYYYRVFFIDEIPIKTALQNQIEYWEWACQNKTIFTTPAKLLPLIKEYKAIIKAYCVYE